MRCSWLHVSRIRRNPHTTAVTSILMVFASSAYAHANTHTHTGIAHCTVRTSWIIISKNVNTKLKWWWKQKFCLLFRPRINARFNRFITRNCLENCVSFFFLQITMYNLCILFFLTKNKVKVFGMSVASNYNIQTAVLPREEKTNCRWIFWGKHHRSLYFLAPLCIYLRHVNSDSPLYHYCFVYIFPLNMLFLPFGRKLLEISIKIKNKLAKIQAIFVCA